MIIEHFQNYLTFTPTDKNSFANRLDTTDQKVGILYDFLILNFIVFMTIAYVIYDYNKYMSYFIVFQAFVSAISDSNILPNLTTFALDVKHFIKEKLNIDNIFAVPEQTEEDEQTYKKVANIFDLIDRYAATITAIMFFYYGITHKKYFFYGVFFYISGFYMLNMSRNATNLTEIRVYHHMWHLCPLLYFLMFLHKEENDTDSDTLLGQIMSFVENKFSTVIPPSFSLSKSTTSTSNN